MRTRTILLATTIAVGSMFVGGQGKGVEFEPLEVPYCIQVGETVYQVRGVRIEDGMGIVDVGSAMTEVIPKSEINSLCGGGFGE